MTSEQLSQIIKFTKPFYKKVGIYHDWNHVIAVRKNAMRISKRYQSINRKVLESACYLHDIGRSVKDEGHPQESFRLAKPFLNKISVKESELEVIQDAILSHDISAVLSAKTLEARILFDADKLEILSVYGFIRVLLFLVNERGMGVDSSVNFLWDYAESVEEKYLYTKQAKQLIRQDMEILKRMIQRYKNWLNNKAF